MVGDGCFGNTKFMDDPHDLDSHASGCIIKSQTCMKNSHSTGTLSYIMCPFSNLCGVMLLCEIFMLVLVVLTAVILI